MILPFVVRHPLIWDSIAFLPGLLFRFLFLLFCFLLLRLFLLLLPPSLLPVQAFLLDLVGSLFDPFFNVRVPSMTTRASVGIFYLLAIRTYPS